MQSARIAIVGAACRYPDAGTPEELWENVLAQRRAFRRIPAERLNLADYYSENRSVADAIYSSQAALIADYEFDRNRFRVAGRTFRAVDMTHWLALEVAADALSAAGFPEGECLPRAETGVYLGNSLTGEFSRANLMRLRWPYVRRVLESALAGRNWSADERSSFLASLEESYKLPFPAVNDETLAGGLSNTIAGRICNYFNFQGGGFTVDGACASSLLAVATACSALASGDVDVALAGGVDLSLDPFELIGFSKVGALAADEMRIYDLHSAGFWPGEGCGAVVLMRLDDAVRQNRRILASICGWGISSDGSGGLTRPEVEGQMLAMNRAYRRAGFGIDTVGYFEGHGTGTGVGDPTELRAVSRARREAGGGALPGAIGSVKANIGHTKAAAGVAGLIKATMAVQQGLLPPTTGWDQPHPAIAEEGHEVRLLREGEVWSAAGPLRAGVSAMGFGGINTHVVLEGVETPRRRHLMPRERHLLSSAQDAELLLIVADDFASLDQRLEELEELALRISRSELADLACRLAAERSPGKCRAAIVASRPQDMTKGIQRLRERAHLAPRDAGHLAEQDEYVDVDAGVFYGAGTKASAIGYLFSGQGTGFSRDGGIWARRFETIRDLYGFAELPREGSDAATEIAQPSIVTASLAGLNLLDRCGIEASVGIGHSLGELAAYHWAGAIDKPTLLRLARARGRAIADHGRPGGAMASIGAGEELVAPAIAGKPLVLAGLNTPLQTVISGNEAAIAETVDLFKGAGIAATKLHVSQAFHSFFMDDAAAALLDAVRKETLHPLAAKVISTVTGSELPGGAGLPQILFDQMTAPVRFCEAVRRVEQDVDLWIEVGPGRVLAGMMRGLSDRPAVALDAGGPSLKGLLKALGAAFALGADVDVEALYRGRFHRPFDPAHRARFFTNPCELAPTGDGKSAPMLRETTAGNAPSNGRGSVSTAAKDSVDREAPAPLPAAADLNTLDVVRRMAAQRAELPVETVGKDLRLLGDLHLSSIAVTQLVAESARALGLEPPVWPTEAANATIAEVAEALEQLGAQGPASPARLPDSLDGIDSWVRPFVIEFEERPLPRRSSPRPTDASSSWRIIAADDHPLRAPLQDALDRDAPGGGVALCLPPNPGEPQIDLLLQAARGVVGKKDSRPFVLVQHDGGAAGFARTLYLEHPDRTVCVVDAPIDHPAAPSWIAAEAAAAQGYVEAIYDGDGVRREPRLRLLEETAQWAKKGDVSDFRDGGLQDVADGTGNQRCPLSALLGPEDVVLVTGGGKGIGAECALALARSTGAKLALVGRSRPENDVELAANLERFAAHRVDHRYDSLDLTDRETVRRTVQTIDREFGAVTAILHSAGTNNPRRLDSLDRTAFERTLGPKVRGLENVLSAVDPGRLRLLVAFGSIIARTGMPGEADYAVANEWLTRIVERWKAAHPHCRCLSIEWSVWSGVGMGERLSSVDALRRQGISPITPDAGVAALRELLSRPESPTAVVVAGRFGDPPTLALDRPELPLLRFMERPRLFFPGVELIVEADLSLDTDPYLADHVYQGAALFPAVMGLEAMAQAAQALMNSTQTPEKGDRHHLCEAPSGPFRQMVPVTFFRAAFEDVVLARPVVVPRDGTQTIRLVALKTGPDRVEVALRCQDTDYQTDHFRAACIFDSSAGSDDFAESVVRPETFDADPLPLNPDQDLYGRVLFQRGRLQRVRGYRHLRAKECVAEVQSRPDARWFSQFLPADMVLGDAGARDAAIHGIQACIPHGTLLPTGIDRVVLHGPLQSLVLVHARERSRLGDEFVYDLDVTDSSGKLLERWQGLQLRLIRTTSPAGDWAPPLLATYLERRLAELIPGSLIAVALEQSADLGRHAAGTSAMRQALAADAVITRRGDGKPEVCVLEQAVEQGARHHLCEAPSGPFRQMVPGTFFQTVSASHAGSLTLAVSGNVLATCDIEAVEARTTAVWRDLLGPQRFALAELMSRESNEEFCAAATRVWCAVECLKKAGMATHAPIVFDATHPGGWIVLRSGSRSIVTLVASIRGWSNPLGMAVLAEDSDAGV